VIWSLDSIGEMGVKTLSLKMFMVRNPEAYQTLTYILKGKMVRLNLCEFSFGGTTFSIKMKHHLWHTLPISLLV
jgi:hypothetical protein